MRARIEGSRDGGQILRLVEKRIRPATEAYHALPPLPKEVKIEDALDDTAVFGPPRWPVKLNETDMLDIMRDALRQNRVDLYLQTIVSLPQRKHRYFECFSAVRNAQAPSSHRTVISRS